MSLSRKLSPAEIEKRRRRREHRRAYRKRERPGRRDRSSPPVPTTDDGLRLYPAAGVVGHPLPRS